MTRSHSRPKPLLLLQEAATNDNAHQASVSLLHSATQPRSSLLEDSAASWHNQVSWLDLSLHSSDFSSTDLRVLRTSVTTCGSDPTTSSTIAAVVSYPTLVYKLLFQPKSTRKESPVALTSPKVPPPDTNDPALWQQYVDFISNPAHFNQLPGSTPEERQQLVKYCQQRYAELTIQHDAVASALQTNPEFARFYANYTVTLATTANYTETQQFLRFIKIIPAVWICFSGPQPTSRTQLMDTLQHRLVTLMHAKYACSVPARKRVLTKQSNKSKSRVTKSKITPVLVTINAAQSLSCAQQMIRMHASRRKQVLLPQTVISATSLDLDVSGNSDIVAAILPAYNKDRSIDEISSRLCASLTRPKTNILLDWTFFISDPHNLTVEFVSINKGKPLPVLAAIDDATEHY